MVNPKLLSLHRWLRETWLLCCRSLNWPLKTTNPNHVGLTKRILERDCYCPYSLCHWPLPRGWYIFLLPKCTCHGIMILMYKMCYLIIFAAPSLQQNLQFVTVKNHHKLHFLRLGLTVKNIGVSDSLWQFFVKRR